MIMTIPFDIYYTYAKEEEKEQQPDLYKKIESRLVFIYTMNFIVLFFVNKFVITFLIGYFKSGEFSRKKKNYLWINKNWNKNSCIFYFNRSNNTFDTDI